MPEAAAPQGALADLILARLLLPAAKPPAPGAVFKTVAELFRRKPSRERFDETLAGLRATGLLTPKGQALTDAGRERGLKYLGVSALPKGCNWGTIKAKYLVPRALGLTPGSAESYKRIATADKLAARLVKLKAGLPAETPDGLGGAFEALVCRALGFPNRVALKDIRDEVVEQKLEELTGSDLIDLKALRLVALDGVFDAADEESAGEGPDVPFDMAAFARIVEEAARASKTGWFGDNKVFISHVWKQLQSHSQLREMKVDTFKARLVEANRSRLMSLLPADLNQNFPPADLEESATVQYPATFHFILLGGTR